MREPTDTEILDHIEHLYSTGLHDTWKTFMKDVAVSGFRKAGRISWSRAQMVLEEIRHINVKLS